MSQELALEYVKNGENVLITGAGGVGKSYVVKQCINHSTLLSAPSGIAALNIGGVTCHKAFGLPIGLVTDRDYYVSSKIRDRLFAVTRIIIDEVGMLRADYLDLINYKLQQVKGNKKLFGGVQMVLVGDFLQLEPIVGYNEGSIFREEYDTPFAFGANSFRNFKVIELSKVYRQDNKRQVLMLNSIRKKDKWASKAIEYISNECKDYDIDDDQLHLCSRKRDAEVINHKWYNRIDEQEISYYAVIQGQFSDSEKPVPDEIKLKVGAKVLICANDIDNTYVNGDRGEVVKLNLNSVIVKLSSGKTVTVVESEWEKYDYTSVKGSLSKEVVATYKQMPIKLGWAVTIHASQGLTLDKIAIDVGQGCFSHGQLYVALSRITDLRNLSFVTPISVRDAIVKQDAINFYKGISKNE